MNPEIRSILFPPMSFRWFLVSLLFGIAAALTLFSGLSLPLGRGLMAETSEVFVTLGAAFTGPIGGLIIGLLQGIMYAPERNIPSHMLAGFLWGAWYTVLWEWSRREGRGRWARAALWAATIPVYYYIFLLPLHLGIASMTIGVPFLPLFSETAVKILPEVAFTLLVTAIVIAIIPEKYSGPLGRR